jgi:hypothetical protein
MNKAFLASSWGNASLRALRARIWERHKNDERGQVWVAEKVRPELDPACGTSQLEIADACLDAIEAASEFVLLDTGEYGTQLSYQDAFSEVSFLEMELFQAAILAKPITIYLVGSVAERSPLGKLAARLTHDVRAYRLETLAEAELAIMRQFDGGIGNSSRIDLSKTLVRAIVQSRHTDWRNQRLLEEPQFMDGHVCGPASDRAELDVADHYLNLAEQHRETNRVLSRTWIAMRTLMPMHYADTIDPRAIELWDRALRHWSRASAWRGMHGHLWLGNISVLGSLVQLRSRVEKPFFDPENKDGGDLYDALASVYYSISKQMPRVIGSRLLERASAYVDEGLSTRDTRHRRTLLPLRGSIHSRRWHFREAAKDYGEALDAAVLHDDGPGKIGFLMTELGFTELFLLNPRRGRQRIEDGLSYMVLGAASPGFRSRALRKYVIASLACGDLYTARKSAREIMTLVEENQLHDQNIWFVRRLARR